MKKTKRNSRIYCCPCTNDLVFLFYDRIYSGPCLQYALVPVCVFLSSYTVCVLRRRAFCFQIGVLWIHRLPQTLDESRRRTKAECDTDHRCCTGELIRDMSHTHTPTHTLRSYLHTWITENVHSYTQRHVHSRHTLSRTHSCSFTRDLNFNCQGRSVLNWACKRFSLFLLLFFSFFFSFRKVWMFMCVCICVVGVKAVIQSALKALPHQLNCKKRTIAHTNKSALKLNNADKRFFFFKSKEKHH